MESCFKLTTEFPGRLYKTAKLSLLFELQCSHNNALRIPQVRKISPTYAVGETID